MRSRTIFVWLFGATLLTLTGNKVLNATYTCSGTNCATAGYDSQRLQARLKLEWMYLPYYGPFWGARIVDIGPTSPLQALNLQLGDVITRLDGVRISDGKYWVQDPTGGYYALPECESHHSNTQVRFIRSGQQNPQNGWVNLGPPWPPVGPPVPVWPGIPGTPPPGNIIYP